MEKRPRKRKRALENPLAQSQCLPGKHGVFDFCRLRDLDPELSLDSLHPRWRRPWPATALVRPGFNPPAGAAQGKVTMIIETYPLEDVPNAMSALRTGKPRFRVVFTV